MPVLIVDRSAEDADPAGRVLNKCKIQNPLTILKSGADYISYFEIIDSHHRHPPLPRVAGLNNGTFSGIEVLRRLRELKQAETLLFSRFQESKTTMSSIKTISPERPFFSSKPRVSKMCFK
jgi:hypothetical protein